MNGNDNPELTTPAGGLKIQQDALAIPLRSVSKSEIQERVEDWLNSALEVHSAIDLYAYLKQIELAIETAEKLLKPQAITSFYDRHSGVQEGDALGHKVNVVYTSKWLFTKEVDHLKAQQKLEMDALQAKEKAEGLASKTETPILKITLKK